MPRVPVEDQPGFDEAVTAVVRALTAAGYPHLWSPAKRDYLARVVLAAGLEAGAIELGCPHVVTSDEGTSYCALAESTARRSDGSSEVG